MVEPAETFCLVVYDVVDDAIRHRFSEACLDYGLERFQMSAFWGHLTASRRKELFLRLIELLGKSPGRILVQPVGAEDLERRFVLHQKPSPLPGEGFAEPEKKHRDFPEPGREKPTIVKL
jgi:CRISPR-associated protein Cas2